METGDAITLESAVRGVSEAIARLEKVRSSFSIDWSVHSLAQPIRELTEAIRAGLYPSPPTAERTHEPSLVKDRLWRTKDLAVYFGTSAVAAAKMAERHGIPHMRIGRTRLYDPAVVKRWLAGRGEKGNVRK